MIVSSARSVIAGLVVLLFGLASLRHCQAYDWEDEGIRSTTHFEIHYEQDDEDPDYASEDYIDDIACAFEHAWTHQVDNTGLRAPLGTTGENPQKIMIYVYVQIGQKTYTMQGVPPYLLFHNGYDEDQRKFIPAHEFHHCIQQAFPGWPTAVKWITEGTATWMEEDEWDDLNTYVDHADDFLANPGTGLLSRTTDTAGRSCALFFMYLAEDCDLDMSDVYEKFEDLDGENGLPPNFRKAIAFELGDDEAPYHGTHIKTAYKNFARACLFKTGTYGFSDGGASNLADVAAVNHGADPGDENIEDYYVGAATDSSVTEMATGALGDLSARYVYIPRPSDLVSEQGEDANLYIPTDLYTIFNKNGHNDWGVWVIDDKDNALNANETHTDLDMSVQTPFHKVNDSFGEHERSEWHAPNLCASCYES